MSGIWLREKSGRASFLPARRKKSLIASSSLGDPCGMSEEAIGAKANWSGNPTKELCR